MKCTNRIRFDQGLRWLDVKVGDLVTACQLFDKIPKRNIVDYHARWKYADIGLWGESLQIWDTMKNKKVKKEIGSSSSEGAGKIKECC
ncbi:hypothetical protein MLD38_029284 [Melastoma candidum]|uniref:Uncharacterized protein n=1 Tax=Melastoma candidum TaxID=119954 RepID=A0ACB9N5S3_9MYRT|nr:hypothetical protein MLD38_029284 [Melastoma candidum]